MRLIFTALVGGSPVDLAVDAEDGTRVVDLAASLGEQFPAATAPSDGRAALHVVGRDRPAAEPPRLYVGDDLVDPDLPLSESPIRHASVVSVGVPGEVLDLQPHGLIELRVVSGPGAGVVRFLDPGEYSLGSGDACDLRLDDPEVPSYAGSVRIFADGRVEIVPADEAMRQRPAPERQWPLEGPIVLGTKPMQNRKKHKPGKPIPDLTITTSPGDDIPLLHLERTAVTGVVEWPAGEQLAIGSVLLQWRPPAPPDASLSPNPAGGTLDYNRPPRLLPPPRKSAFTLPQEPKPSDKMPFPLAMMFLPVAAGLILFFVAGRQPYMLLIMLMSPLMALSTFTSGRRQNKQRYMREFNEYVDRTEKIQGDALGSLVLERVARRRDHADPAEVLLIATGPRARLWERRITDPDFLELRVGTADQPSEVTMTVPQREQHEGALVWTAPDVPVTVPLAGTGVLGVAGPEESRYGAARWMLAQTAVLQSPADVDMVLLSATGAVTEWSWVRWLPHMRSDIGDSELAHIGVDEESTARRIHELLGELERRGDPKRGPFQPMLVVLDGARQLRLLPGVPDLLQKGPAAGIQFLCLDADARLLPEECKAVIDIAPHGTRLTRSGHGVVEGVRLDAVTPGWAELVARSLAPIRDVSDVAAGGDLPTSSRLLNVLRLDPATPEGVLERWRAVGRTTEAVIGEGGEGPFAIDIRRDGPHGLVAGTTGAGKSELLQTIIASLAVNNRPDEMNFVLVDYKGGAAFKDCNNLPHTVGMVTDLDAHLTTRALESLGAELRRREHQLAAADAKDIEDYLAAKGPDDEPMPRLLIVIDEFAALVAELPDFVTGLVDIARRGRSLGVHLILATQRPQGVVTPEIKSNTNLRIALRVTDEGDSGDVIEAPHAAHIAKSTPGRGYARLGHSSLVAFQSSRVGGRPRGEDAKAEIGLRSLDFSGLGRPEAARADAGDEDMSIPTDLASLVEAAREASNRSGVTAPPSPWLPAMPEVVTLDDVLREFPAAEPARDSLRIPFGMVDVPSQQRRDVASVDLALGSHFAIVGAPRSGRSTVLRAIAGTIARFCSPADVHLYGVDCGNNALLPLVGLPHTGAVVTRDQTDRMDRLLSRLRALMSQRQQELAVSGFADVTEQRAQVAPEKRMPYVVVLFDRWEGFYQAYESLDGGRFVAGWQQILQEGAAAGIRIVMTGDRTLLVGRMGTMLDDKLMLRMVDPADFGSIGIPLREVPSSFADGRGFRAEGLRETQVALLAEDRAGTAQVAALQAIGRDAAARYDDLPDEARPFRLDVLPMRITLEEARALQRRPIPSDELVVAVGGDTLSLRSLHAFEHGPGLLVAGPRRSGRSTTLLAMASFALDGDWNVVVVTPRASALSRLAGRDRVRGPYGTGDRKELETALAEARADSRPSLTLVDDIELLNDEMVGDSLAEHLALLRDTGHVVVGAGTSGDLVSVYRGLVSTLKKGGSGVLLSPQTSSDPDLFGTTLTRSVLGQSLPPGGGFLMRAGAPAERVQVVLPD